MKGHAMARKVSSSGIFRAIGAIAGDVL